MKMFKKIKNIENAYAPRLSTREGKTVQAQLNELTHEYGDIIAKPLKLQVFHGFKWYQAACKKKNGKLYIDMHECMVPKSGKVPGCKRISDLAYEKLFPEGD